MSAFRKNKNPSGRRRVGRSVLARGVAVAGVAVLAASLASLVGGAGAKAVPTSHLSRVAVPPGVVLARKLAAQDSSTPTWKAPGPSFDAKKASGKTVWFISNNLSTPFQTDQANGLAEALQTVGVKLVKFDGKGQLPEYTRGIDEAIAAKANAILLGGVEPQFVGAAMASAKAAGIPVIGTQIHDPGVIPPDQRKFSVAAEVGHCHACAARMMADWAVADSGGKIDGVVLWFSDLPDVTKPLLNGFLGEMHKLCPTTCKLKTIDVPIAQWQTRLPTLTRTLLQTDPKINYLFPQVDGQALFMVPAVHQAHAQGRVKMVSFNGSQGMLQYLAKHDVVGADVGSVAIWQGWAFADQTLRVLTGTLPVKVFGFPPVIPERLFTWKNIKKREPQ